MKIILSVILINMLVSSTLCASILQPFRRSSLDQTTISDHALRIAALELSVSQILVQLNRDGRRTSSLQRRPEIRGSSRSDTSVPSLRRFQSNQSGGGVRLQEESLSPPE